MGNPASNTKDCFREFLGMKMTGVLFDVMPISRADLKAGNTTMIFEDGRGLTISSRGSYWVESEKEVTRAVEITAAELDERIRDLQIDRKHLDPNEGSINFHMKPRTFRFDGLPEKSLEEYASRKKELELELIEVSEKICELTGC